MKKNNQLIPEDYASLLAEVKERVRAAQYDALKAVNKELVALYWDIGRMVTERQAAGAHGTAVVKRLAADLQVDFPGIVGFSWRNLFNMSEFFAAYRDKPKLQPLAAIIGWTQNLVILQRCKELLDREFYLRMTAKFGWTKNVLIHQIENQSYEKTLLGQTNFNKALTPKLRAQAKLAIKDEYTFDFLELGEEHAERELERALVGRIEHFLRAMGGVFAFVGSQYRLEVDGREFFIDLLLFHRRLRCLIAIELKVGEFQPEFVGKMQFYLTALYLQVKEKGENPSIGISSARKSTGPSSSMLSIMRLSQSVSRPTASSSACPGNSKGSCRDLRKSPDCWRMGAELHDKEFTLWSMSFTPHDLRFTAF